MRTTLNIDDALLAIQVTAPNGEFSEVDLPNLGNGVYTGKLATDVVGNYDVIVLASDNIVNGDYRNSQYLITTEHSFYVSPFEEPKELTGKWYIEEAIRILNEIRTSCQENGCSLTNKQKRDIDNSIEYLETALGYFIDDPNDPDADGNHLLKTKNGLKFYANVTSAVKLYFKQVPV